MLDTGGHTALVRALVFSRNGKTLYSGGDDRVVRVWDWQAGTTQFFIRVPVGQGEFGKVYALALSPNERFLAIAAETRPVCKTRGCTYILIYDAKNGEFLRGLNGGHSGQVLSLSFSRDGRRLLSSGNDETAIVWDFGAGAPLFRLEGHKNSIYRARFLDDDNRVVTASDDSTLRLWDSRTGQLLADMRGHKGRVFRMDVSPDGELIASATELSGEIMLWNAHTGELIRKFDKVAHGIGGLTFDRSGRFLLTGHVPSRKSRGTTDVWNVRTGKRLQSYKKHGNSAIATVRTVPRTEFAVSGDKNGEVHFWNIRTGKAHKVLRGSGDTIWAVDVEPGDNGIGWGKTWTGEAIGARGPITHWLDLPHGPRWWRTELGQPQRIAQVLRLSALPMKGKNAETGDYYSLGRRSGGRRTLVTVRKNGEIHTVVQRTSGNGYRHATYGLSPNFDRIVSGGDNGHLTSYRLDGTSDGEYLGHNGTIWSVAASRDGRFLVSGGDDQVVRLWNLLTRDLVANLFHGNDGSWVLWTPQGYYTGSENAGKMVGWLSYQPGQQDKPGGIRFFHASDLPALNRPDVVSKTIELGDTKAAIDVLSKSEPQLRRTFRDWIEEKVRQLKK